MMVYAWVALLSPMATAPKLKVDSVTAIAAPETMECEGPVGATAGWLESSEQVTSAAVRNRAAMARERRAERARKVRARNIGVLLRGRGFSASAAGSSRH